MNFRDFILLFTICFVWGLNIVVTRWVVFDAAVPPLFFAAIRFLGVAILLIPFLRPIPKNLKTLFMVSFFIGSGHFALLFVGLREGRQQSLCDGDDMMVGVAVTTAVKVVGGAKST